MDGDGKRWLDSRVGYETLSVDVLTERRDGRIVAACSFSVPFGDEYTVMIWAGEGVAWARCLPKWFRHAFVELDVQQVIGMIDATNAKSIQLAARIGCMETGRRFPQPDGAVLIEFAMHRDDCKWID
jgi:RimJ/RimL family protein N-acetyltransferase